MKKFTKSLLVLALLVLAVGGAKASETSIYTKDYSTEADKEGVPFWGSVPSGASVNVKDGLLVIENTEEQAQMYTLQLHIGSGIKTKAGLDYQVKITYNTTKENGGTVWIGLGSWAGDRPTNYGATFAECSAEEFKVLTWDVSDFYQTADDNFVMFQSGKFVGTINIQKVEIIEIAPDDPLAVPKEALQKLIDAAKLHIAYGKTEASFSALTTEITEAQAAHDDAEATESSLAKAKDDLQAAIDALKLEDGFTNLTTDMFKSWDSNTAPTTGTDAGCAYVLNESTGQPYGDGSVNYLKFADVSDFSKLIITGGNGTPRIMMNRLEVGNGGGDANGGAYVQIKDDFVDGKKEVDLTAYNYAHLNAIKEGAWDAKVTVTGMYLYREITVGETGYATFGSLYKNAKPNSVTAYAAKYEGGQVTLTPVTNVPAGKGVVIMGDEGSYAPTFDVEADDIVSDLKVSNGTVVGDESTIYVLANGASGIGFYLLKSGNKLAAGKAYLEIGGGGARAFVGISGMDVTGISTVKQAEGKKDDVIYNLNGQRVSNPRKGLFIKNGVKFLVD